MGRNRTKKSTEKKPAEILPDLTLDLIPASETPSKKIEIEVINPEVMEQSRVETLDVQTPEAKDFDPSEDIYLEIHRGNIFHYFSSAVIAPVKYTDRRAFNDIQSMHREFLVFANGSSMDLNDDLLLLQINLSEMDKAKLEILGSVAYYPAALPITRAIKILVISEKIKKAIISDAQVFSGGFIPENLFSIAATTRQFDIKSVKTSSSKTSELRSDLRLFDRMLGLFAFLRNYPLLISDKTTQYKTLPDHFIYAMQVLEPQFGSQIVQKLPISDFYAFLFERNTPEDKQLLKWIFERITIEDNFHDDDIIAFQKVFTSVKDDSLPSSHVKSIFDALKKSLERKAVLPVIETSKSKSALPLFLFAFLRTYGSLNNIEVARRDIANVFSSLYGEYAFALLGYFYGYSSLKNSDERMTFANPAIAYFKLNEKKQAIKFQLETDFDQAIIELVYQKVFGGQRVEIDNIEGKMASDSHQTLPGEEFEVAVQSYRLIDLDYKRIRVNSIARPEPQSVNSTHVDFRKELLRVPEQIPYLSDFGVLCRRLGLKEMNTINSSTDIMKINLTELVTKNYYLKSDLLRRLEDKKPAVSPEEFSIRLMLAKTIGEV